MATGSPRMSDAQVRRIAAQESANALEAEAFLSLDYLTEEYGDDGARVREGIEQTITRLHWASLTPAQRAAGLTRLTPSSTGRPERT